MTLTAADFVDVTTRAGRRVHYAEIAKPRYRDRLITLCGHPEHPRTNTDTWPRCAVCDEGRTRRMTGARP